ncbi:MAG: prepilin-type N-terminal cleavage/methylation domain-containing protein [Deltaproteobacteria bacterium]|nr:prepilin-type N-terminal cleavage/methylation domain-containing protein [Deltaproteobacteria bacterium]
MRKKRQKGSRNSKGFTLIELLIAMAVSGIVMVVIYWVYSNQQKSYGIQEDIVAMQQNVRASMDVMEMEIRMAGYDPLKLGNFGITDIRMKDINDAPNVNGNGSVEFTIDRNGDGIVTAGDETVYFCIFDAGGDGRSDLGLRYGGGGRQLLGENMAALGFAYAFDDDGDGNLDTSPGGNVVWAYDSNNDNLLDRRLDTDDNGVIDTNDNAAGSALPAPIPLTIPPASIRSVKIWLLAETIHPDTKYSDTRTYVVANQRITPNNNFRHQLVTTTIRCRNMGL